MRQGNALIFKDPFNLLTPQQAIVCYLGAAEILFFAAFNSKYAGGLLCEGETHGIKFKVNQDWDDIRKVNVVFTEGTYKE